MGGRDPRQVCGALLRLGKLITDAAAGVVAMIEGRSERTEPMTSYDIMRRDVGSMQGMGLFGGG